MTPLEATMDSADQPHDPRLRRALAHGDVKFASAAAAAGGVIACIAVASLLTLDRGVGQVVPALALMLIVIAAAAVGGPAAGACTALGATLSYNFWHTKPYLSLRIHSASDVITTLLLLAAGLAVGALARAREIQASEAADERGMLGVLAMQADLLAAGASVDEVWTVTRRALVQHLDRSGARYEPFGAEAPPLARITRTDTLPRSPQGGVVTLHLGRHGFHLPRDGAELPVVHAGQPVGRIVLVPNDAGDGVTIVERQFALTLAEQFGTVAADAGGRTLDERDRCASSLHTSRRARGGSHRPQPRNSAR